MYVCMYVHMKAGTLCWYIPTKNSSLLCFLLVCLPNLMVLMNCCSYVKKLVTNQSAGMPRSEGCRSGNASATETVDPRSNPIRMYGFRKEIDSNGVL
jgi:hypothetical protein